MSAKHRCHECGHRPGPRRLPTTKDGTNRLKKAPCNCSCHSEPVAAHPWLQTDVTIPEHDAVCESCNRPLYADAGDSWAESRGRDADGWTTVTTCVECIELADIEGEHMALWEGWL